MNKPKLGGHYIDKEIIIKRRYMGSLKKSFIFNFE